MADVQPELIALGFIWYVAFLFSTTCHEAAHALAAKIGGDDWERRHPRRAAWMALAGPATNYTLMLLAAVALRLGSAYQWLHVDETNGRADFPTSVLGVFFFLNLLLGTFNLLPVPPLDGSTGIMLFMSETRAHRYLDWLRGNSYAMVGLVVAVFGFQYVFQPIEGAAMYALLPRELLVAIFRTIFRL